MCASLPYGRDYVCSPAWAGHGVRDLPLSHSCFTSQSTTQYPPLAGPILSNKPLSLSLEIFTLMLSGLISKATAISLLVMYGFADMI